MSGVCKCIFIPHPLTREELPHQLTGLRQNVTPRTLSGRSSCPPLSNHGDFLFFKEKKKELQPDVNKPISIWSGETFWWQGDIEGIYYFQCLEVSSHI